MRVKAILLALALLAGATPASASTVTRAPWLETAAPVTKGDITAVAALDSSNAWAVGYRLVSDREAQTVALRWDGASWKEESRLPRTSFPQALEVRAANDIWTLGDGVQHWDGTAWTEAVFPGGPGGRFVPDALDSAADGSAWVVGRQVAGGIKNEVPAIFFWNGAAWARQILPDVGRAALSSVAVVAPNDVWAVGFTLSTPSAPQATLVLHWDGVAWTRVASPQVAGGHTWFSGVSAAGRSVWAVGGGNTGGADQPFAAAWDGSSWSASRVPSVPDGKLRAVSVTGSGEVWAVGGKDAVSVALRWQPALQRWLRMPAPDIVVRGFAGVPGSSRLWAVGVRKSGDLVPVIARFR